VTEAEDRLMRCIGELTGEKTPGTPVRALHQAYRGRWIAAASVAVILVAAGLVWEKWESKPSVVTPYGKISSVVLPDGTEITLNAHSRLDYGKDWKEGRDREVWLTGEALFHVTKKPLHDRFIVHTDHFDVIVTGTIFNVVNIPDENQGGVLLKEGSVTIREEDGQELKMVPGDYVRLKDNRLLKQDTNQDDITAWTENKVDFDNTPFSEVIKMIQLHYGVKVEVSDPRLLSINLNGIFPNDNLDVLLKALEATKEFKVTKDGDKVVIQSPL
jgi:ferric-dicitrate binding protein FerR (iron transport regulator)